MKKSRLGREAGRGNQAACPKRRCRSVPSQPCRRGFAMMLAIVMLVVVTVVGMAGVRGVLEMHRQLQREEFRRQADWLAEAGISRARAQRQADPKYTGEDWKPELPDWGGRSAVVNIAVAAAEGENQPPKVTVTVQFPAESPRRVKVTRTGSVGAGGQFTSKAL